MTKKHCHSNSNQRLLRELNQLAECLNLPRGSMTIECWAIAIYQELQRRLDAGETMPPAYGN